ncbi:MAG: hypothetical protein JW832_15620 [Deltaproteobacteria bacterium]|nr:hypothetical protein [Deltaproteobacteria bacterium]
MTFTPIDKRLVERNDLAFQEKYLKDSARHTPDAADKFETSEIEHTPICLYQKKTVLTGQALETASKNES